MRLFKKREQMIVGPKKKGKVFITTKEGAILPYPTLEKYSIEKRSKQLKKERQWAEAEGLVSRPYDPDSFLTLYESNPIFFATVNQIAVDVAGLGWKLVPKEGKENENEKNKIDEFISNLEEPLRRLFKSVLIDWGVIGYFGIEVTRNGKGEVDGLYHIPAYSLWAHSDKIRFCQKRGLKKVWFKKFGEERNFSSETGKEGQFDLETRANEIIFYKTHYPKNEYYGVPNILPAVGSVLSLIGIRDYNLSFFQNYGVPDYFVTLEGEWEEDSAKIIQNFLNTEIKGTENAHKTLVLQTPEGGTAKFEPLSVEVKEGSFRLYQQILREDILAAYSMPPYRLGIAVVGKLSGNVAQEATRTYIQSVVEPLQQDLEDIMNMIFEKGLDCNSYEFKFNDIDIRDIDAEVSRYNSLIERGVMTPNEARSLLGIGEPYPGGDSFYISGSLTEIGEAELEKRDREQLRFMAEQERLSKEIKKIREAEMEDKDKEELIKKQMLKIIIGKKIRGEELSKEEKDLLEEALEEEKRKKEGGL